MHFSYLLIVNRAITVIDCDEEAMVSSPNSTVSSVSGKRSEREEINCGVKL
ncbi:hypothetical protein F511_39688 [Dorcoceras hygrometricum]|uniref:HD-ZIP protein N-terminal domain-containing protein n=1 Tax=Dorcoceras hygrometricum TaxID=472368 RepID=A0A2Z7A0A4_9LAMI|nr:hypothetical protein F511_39688 [Dorcoceras hygrometricum]